VLFSTTTNSFDDPQAAFRERSNAELVRAWVVLNTCRIEPLVANADKIIRVGEKIFGKGMMARVMRPTFFGHFCAGEDNESIKPCLSKLYSQGIGGILDYAAEHDIPQSGTASTDDQDIVVLDRDTGVICRTYEYTSEEDCDNNVTTFLHCIRAVKDTSPEGFAAIKLTALGNPLLLERMSMAIEEIRRFFSVLDKAGDGLVGRETLGVVWKDHFSNITEAELDKRFEAASFYSEDYGRPMMDYIQYTEGLTLRELPGLVKDCTTAGPLYEATPSAEELQLMQNMERRLDVLAKEALALNVRLMIDAEQTYFQPAIDSLVLGLQREYNREYPAIFNTYQCYLKDSRGRLEADIERARRDGFLWAAKLVRGAYMVSERQRAERLCLADPIHASLEDTHDNFNDCVRLVLEHIARGTGYNLLVASHNQASVEQTLAGMDDLGIERGSGGVYFGQLLGMGDHLTSVLGQKGYKAYKYVPYGPIDDVMPYLVRRAQENSTLLGGAHKERAMLAAELKRRLFG
jgi:proline dehydrogenase